MRNHPQTFANHRRIPPAAFAIAFLVLITEVAVRLVAAVQSPGFGSAWAVVVAAALVVLGYFARRNAQTVQDRLIRLEMRRRLEHLLPLDRHSEIARLSLPQLIALRFAGDAELPTLMGEVLADGLAPTAIKQKISVWQADWLRV